MDEIQWLPALILFDDYYGDWDTFLDAVYQRFTEDFIKNKPKFEGRRLGIKRHPLTHGKEATFWHFIQEGKIEDDRTPDFRRMERIAWPKPIIEHAQELQQAHSMIKVWRNQRRNNESRILLWLESKEYLVVLADRGNYLLPWTAYAVFREHSKRKLQQEYEKYWRDKA